MTRVRVSNAEDRGRNLSMPNNSSGGDLVVTACRGALKWMTVIEGSVEIDTGQGVR